LGGRGDKEEKISSLLLPVGRSARTLVTVLTELLRIPLNEILHYRVNLILVFCKKHPKKKAVHENIRL